MSNGTLLVLRDGKYTRKKLKSFRIHDEWGAAKDYGATFKGEVFIEEGADGIDLAMFKQSLEQPPRKNEKAAGFAFGAVCSVGLIMLLVAMRQLMLVHLLH
jgi:hypothetical protein